MEIQTLTDIQAEKERLHKAISNKEAEISAIWHDVFHTVDTAAMSRSQRMLHYANTGAGLVDGAILGWKLYRRLSAAGSFFRRKRK